MKLKKIIVSMAWLLSSPLTVVQAAVELTSEAAASRQPVMNITITERCNSIHAATTAVSRRADKLGADAFYIHHYGNSNNGGNWRIVASLYHKDSPVINDKEKYRVFNGIKELTKNDASELQSFGTVSVTGFFPAQPDITDAITKAAKQQGADAFFITRQTDTNRGGNQLISANIYKSNAPKRKQQHENALSEAGLQTATADTPESASDAGALPQQSLKKKHHSVVTLPDGTPVQQLSKAAAAQRTPFGSITFTGHFASTLRISEEAARRAAAKGARYYQITRQSQNHSGGNLTVSAHLFK